MDYHTIVISLWFVKNLEEFVTSCDVAVAKQHCHVTVRKWFIS